MYSDMSMRTIACSESNMNSARARASSVLPTPVGPRNRKEPLGGALQVRVSLGPLQLPVCLLELGLGRLDRVDRVLLVLPARLHLARALPQLGQFGLDRLAAPHRRLVLFLLQRLALDLELLDAPFDLVDLDRHRVDLDLEPRGRLVDQV